jgi:DNA-binding beta-propeller fold protein YncE/mono/diheme cytochrome c family protein
MRSTSTAFLLVCLASSLGFAACNTGDHAARPPSDAPSAAPSSADPTPAAPAKVHKKPPVREGGALVRSPSEDTLWLADEDQLVVRRIALPVDARRPFVSVKMPGPPTAVLALDDRVLVTIRGIAKGDGPAPAIEGPGLLLVMRPDSAAGLVEVARVELPADAWGLAVTPDEKIALVTSAWTHRVSAVDIAAGKKLWSLDVPREPRGVVVMPDGKTAYVTHLVRASLSRIDAIDGEARVRSVPFPAAPLRTPPDPVRREAATLAYSAVLSPDGARLFVPRHALGAMGESAWNGQNTVDILLTADETPLAERASRWYVMQTKAFQKIDFGFSRDDPHMTGPAPAQISDAFVQPRAIVYRKKTRTLLLASEGTDKLVELDALSVDPSLGALRSYDLGGDPERERPGITRCGAPSGVALSEDEGTAFVFCRSSHDLAVVSLDPYDKKIPYEFTSPALISLGPDLAGEGAALGRRLFFSARDSMMSTAFACAACHPEGRDDGHVWQEDMQAPYVEPGKPKPKMDTLAMHAFEGMQMHDGFVKGVPRQTPMLAGRVAAFGPYGWKGESQTLRHRVIVGFGLHHWLGGGGWGDGDLRIARAEAIGEFMRKALVPPPRENREPTDEEKRGEKIFNDSNVGCATCHLPKTEYTNRAVVGFGEWIVDKARFAPEPENWNFKTPSLRYIGGSPPYYHDGSSATLEELVERNGKRMGHTDHLSKDERAALVAFMKTL